jgi:NADH-quinone oxidoreductase subunit C
MSQFLESIRSSQIQEHIREVRSYAGEMTLEVYPQSLLTVMQMLRSRFGFTYLVDMTASDLYQDGERFEVSYNLVNLDEGQRLRVCVKVQEEEPVLESVTGIWPSANWHEREAFDMMGIRFRNHPDLRRMYLPEDFQWHPLRKEFPLLGIPGTIPMPEKNAPKEYK